MKTYAEEQLEKIRAAARRGKKYVFRAAGMDRMDRRDYTPDEGALVVKIQPHGCPRNGTFGQCYIADAETGEFIGMVALASLTPA